MNPSQLRPTAALAVDAGQTEIKVRSIGTAPFARRFHGIQTDRELLPQLAAVAVASSRELAAPFPQVAVGTSGLSERENDADVLLALCAEAGAERVLLTHDSVTSYLGALGPDQGVVVAAGTGVVTLGVGPEAIARVDGWGHIMGDAGSGYWIGREALDAAMRAHDGRGPETGLTDAVTQAFPRLEQAYLELQADPDRVRLVASLAPAVSELAAVDVVADGICRRAGEQLALSALTAARLTGIAAQPGPAFCLVGGVFRSDAVRGACLAALDRELPGHRVVAALGDGLMGAERLLSLAADHPLNRLVTVSGSGRGVARTG